MNPAGRTRRTVWSISPKGTNLAHYAAFPAALVEPMLRSSLSERGCCPRCGGPWRRVVKKPDMNQRPIRNVDKADGEHPNVNWDGYPRSAGQAYQAWRNANPDVTLTWHPSCACYPPPTRGPVRCGRCGGSGRETQFVKATQGYPINQLGGGRDNSGGLSNTPPTETGSPCPHCSGTGTVTGDVWPDDVDEWEVGPSVVLDPFAGTCTVAEALAGMQKGAEYPATFVGLDYSHTYLADLARERLGLKALAAWERSIDGGDGNAALRALAAEAGEQAQAVMWDGRA